MSLTRSRSALLSAFTSFALASLLCCLPAMGVAQSAAAVPVASRLTQPIDESQQVTLKGTMHRLANSANDKGAVDNGLALDRIQVVLKRSAAQESALQQTLQDLHTPGTPSYHKWLTPAQFGAQFGPSDADIATLSSWLNANGFSVTKVNPGKQTMEISGNAGQFQKTFHAAIHKYQVNGQTHYANASDPKIPAALAPVFGGFASLNNFPARSYHKLLGHATYDTRTHKTTPEWNAPDGGGYDFVLAPGDFAVQYDLNPLYNAGVKGAGQTIAIINEANVSLALVNQYRSLFGLPANPPNVIVDGNDPGIDGVNNPDGPNGASIEAYLDVEEAGAVAPAATIDLVIAGDTALENGLYLAASRAVYSDVAPVLSMSFGYCELLSGAGANAFWNTLWEQAAAQGQTAMVSSGDAGSAGCDDDNTQQYAVYGQQVSGFASTPWNVAVGGTDFYYSSYNSGSSNTIDAQLEQYWGNYAGNPGNASDTPMTTLQTKIPEQPWNNSQFGLNLANDYTQNGETTIAGGSGGASNCATGSGTSCKGWAKPAWQVATGVPADGVRDLPDVSLFASSGINASFYPICAEDGDCQLPAAGSVTQFTGVGGTSASSPAFAAIMALVNEKYGPQGQADYVLYPMFKQYPAAFNDVTVGTNSVPCALTSSAVAPDDCIAATPAYMVSDSTYGTSVEGQIGNTTTKVAEYNAGTGYDLATGLGTIDAYNLVTNWPNVKFATSAVTLTPSQTTFAHGTAITVSGTVTPSSAGGAVALETTSSEPITGAPFAGIVTPFAVSNGAYSGSVDYLPGGTYDIYGSYSGDGTNGAITSAKTSITVTPEASTTALALLNSTGSSVSTSTALQYGTQLLLEATPEGTTSKGSSNSPSGTVSYLNGTASIGSATLNAAGQAELNYAPLPSATPYSVTAKYAGDASYSASTSSAATFTIGKDTPNIFLASGTEGSSIVLVSGKTAITVLVENSAEYNAFVNTPYSNSPLAPTGVVTLTGLPSGTLTFPALSSEVDSGDYLVGGVATVAVPTETPGNYNVTISYPGDANYAAISASGGVTVSAPTGIATTTTASVAATASATVAPNVTFTVTGTTAGGFPTGSMLFFASGNYLGSVALPSSGTGDSVTETVNLNGLLTTGANQLIVQYSGSSVYATSYATANISNGGTPGFSLANSNSINLTAGGNGTSTISVTPLSGLTGSVALTCTVSPTTGTSVPTCSMSGPATLNGGATTATLTVSTTATTTAGGYTVTVNGVDGALASFVTVPVTVTSTSVTTTPAIALSNSGAVTLAAGGGTGNSTITVTPSGGFTGSVALACAVTGTGATTPTCSVASPVTISGTTAGMAALTVTSTASTTAGSYTVTVTGTGTGVTAATTAVSVTVSTATTTPTVTLGGGSSITIAMAGSSGTSAISVTPGGGFTGAVSLACSVSSTVTDAPTCTITTPVTISGTTAGSATLTVLTGSATPGGSYSVTVSGAAAGVTIAPISVSATVQSPTQTPTVTLSSSGSITVGRGATTGNTSTITATPTGSFIGTVTLSCSVTPVATTDPATCTVTSPAIATAGTPATGTLTVSTTASSAALEMPRMRMWPLGGGVAAAALLFFLVPMRRRRISTLLGLLVLVAMVGFSTGCGGGGSSTGGGGSTGTPTGAYSVTVSGTASGVTTIAPITVSVTVN